MAEDREVVAYHESGHAVVAHCVGLPVDQVGIKSDGIAAGYVDYGYGCNMNKTVHKEDPKRQWALEPVARVALAGKVAQRRFKAEAVATEHGGDARRLVEREVEPRSFAFWFFRGLDFASSVPVGGSVCSETNERPHARDQCRLRQPQRGHDVLHFRRDADGRRERVVVKTLDALAVADRAELRRDQRADLRAG